MFRITPQYDRFSLQPCRIRHLKCDEGKPSCSRCSTDGRKCDGYNYDRKLVNEEKKLQNASTPMEQRNSHLILPRMAPQPRWTLLGSEFEKVNFHHAMSCTSNDFGSSTYVVRFWFDHLLPLGPHVDYIKHALIAFGAVHKSFLCSSASMLLAEEGQRCTKAAVWHYNKAMHLLREAMSTPSSTIVETTLVCAFIFICIEILWGHYDKACLHLRSGLNVLSSDGALSTQADFARLRRLAGVFSRLGADVTLFTGEIIFPNSTFYTSYQHKTNVFHQFSSVSEALEQLHALELQLVLSSKNVPNLRPKEDDSGRSAALESLKNWCAHVDIYLSSRADGSSNDQDTFQLKLLTFHRTVWLAFFKNTERKAETMDTGDFIYILNAAEGLLCTPLTHPIFAFDLKIISALAYVCTISKEPTILRKAVTLLRSLNRREAIWNSWELAEIFDAVLAAREQKLWDEKYSYLSLSALANTLVSLQLLKRNNLCSIK